MLQEVGSCNYRRSLAGLYNASIFGFVATTKKNKVSSKFHPAGHVMRCGSLSPGYFCTSKKEVLLNHLKLVYVYTPNQETFIISLRFIASFNLTCISVDFFARSV